MAANWLVITLFTAIWSVVGIVLPIFVPKGPNRSVIQVSLMITGGSCWLFWLCCYMSQMNPLIGPILKRDTLLAMKTYW